MAIAAKKSETKKTSLRPAQNRQAKLSEINRIFAAQAEWLKKWGGVPADK